MRKTQAPRVEVRHVGLASFCMGDAVLLHDQCVAVGYAREERGGGSHKGIPKVGESERAADDEVRLDLIDHLVAERLADLANAHDELDVSNLRFHLGLRNLGGDAFPKALFQRGKELRWV